MNRLLEALKGEQTLVELSQRYQVHANQITELKKQLLAHAADVFSKDRKADQVPSVKDLHAKIDEIHLLLSAMLPPTKRKFS